MSLMFAGTGFRQVVLSIVKKPGLFHPRFFNILQYIFIAACWTY